MQQLFPAEGKTTPAFRFPEFQNKGEWEESTLGDICDMQAGKFVSASEICDVKKILCILVMEGTDCVVIHILLHILVYILLLAGKVLNVVISPMQKVNFTRQNMLLL